MNGEENLILEAKSALFDAMRALGPHRDSVILVGAQAVYQHTGMMNLAVAEFTRDSDLVLDVSILADAPEISGLLRDAGFYQAIGANPGAWLNRKGIPVDLMTPFTLTGGGSRTADISPHMKETARRTPGLEAAIVDNKVMDIQSLEVEAPALSMRVAGPSALMIAKAFKINDRKNSTSRLLDKDALDIYRLLVATEARDLIPVFVILLSDPITKATALAGVKFLSEIFILGEKPIGGVMVARALESIQDASVVSNAVRILMSEILGPLGV